MDLDRLIAELAEVATELSELPQDAFEERLQLRQRQEQLRAASREMLASSGDILSADEVRLRLGQLEAKREQFLGDTRLSHLAGAQTGQGGGMDPKLVHDMHRSMDEAFNLDGVTAEIDRLRRLLGRLEGGQD